MPSIPPAAAASRVRAASFVLSVGAALATTWVMLSHGWVGFDEGLIGLSAEQLLRGALPHADFAYPYTGGLPWLHALAMRLFGVHLMAPRYTLFAAFAAWLPVVWWLAARRVGAGGAAVLTLLAAWWSLTVYPAAMPTWYVLFAATAMVAALERFGDTGRRRWLFTTGLLGGLALITKQTGLYLVAAAMLGVLFDDQHHVGARQGEGGTADAGILLSLALLALLVLRLLARGLTSSGDWLVLVAPVFAVLAVAAARERGLTSDHRARWRALLGKLSVLVAGVALPVAAFVLPYALRGATGALLPGIVAGGLTRLTDLHLALPPAWDLLRHAGLPLVIVALELRFGGRRGAWPVAALAAFCAVWLSSRGVFQYLSVWDLAVLALPAAVLSAAALALRTRALSDRADVPLLTVAAAAAFQGLHLFPYAAPNYVAYVAPLSFLTIAYVASGLGVRRRFVFAAGTLLLFGGVMNRIGAVQTVGNGPIWWDDAHRLPPPRGRLLVTARDSAAYARLVALVAAHRGSGVLYAGPELPQAYFLTASPLAGHDPFEFVPRALTDTNRVASFVDTTRASMVVLKPYPMFLPAIPAAIHGWLAARFPHAEMVDTLFEVRWR